MALMNTNSELEVLIRVLEKFVNIFEGDYTVKIFRVIPNTNVLV